jgi:hypothetical protein
VFSFVDVRQNPLIQHQRQLPLLQLLELQMEHYLKQLAQPYLCWMELELELQELL